MTTTLGGSTLHEPSSIEISDGYTGEQTEAHDGTILTDYTNLFRYRWKLTWLALTQTERDTVRTGYETAGSMSFIPPYTSASFSTVVVRGSWKEIPSKHLGPVRYDVEMELMEVV